MRIVERQYGSCIGRPPADRHSIAVPRKDAASIRAEQRRRSEISAKSDESTRVRFGWVENQRLRHGSLRHLPSVSSSFLASPAAFVAGYCVTISSNRCFAFSVLPSFSNDRANSNLAAAAFSTFSSSLAAGFSGTASFDFSGSFDAVFPLGSSPAG